MKAFGRILSSTLCAVLLCGSLTVARGAQPPLVPIEPPVEEPTLGVLSGDWELETDLATGQSDLADLVHEAQLWATGAQVSILSPAALEQGEEAEPLTVGEPLTATQCASIYTAGDTLYTVELSALQLKDWIDRVSLQYSYEEGHITAGETAAIDQIYGISYEVFLGNPAGMRVGNLTYQGEPVSINQTFQVAVSGSRLSATAQEDPWGWYEATRLTLESSKVLWDASTSEAFAGCGGRVSAILARYMETLVDENGEIAPPKARSHWKLYPATSEDALRPVTRLQFVEALYDAAGSPAVGEGVHTFTDLSQPSAAASWAVEKGIVMGNGAGQFLPDSPVSREQALVMLLRYDVSRNAGPQGAWMVALPYADAASSSGWAAEALMWNVLRGYLLPDDGGNLNPQASLTAIRLEDAIQSLQTWQAPSQTDNEKGE